MYGGFIWAVSSRGCGGHLWLYKRGQMGPFIEATGVDILGWAEFFVLYLFYYLLLLILYLFSRGTAGIACPMLKM
jgi:hypothetical protein